MNLVFRDLDDINRLHCDGALDVARTIGHSYITTDFVLNSYGDNEHPVIQLIDEKKIRLRTFTYEEFYEIEKLYAKHKNSLSLTDCSVIFCAIITKSVLISKEKILLDISTKYSITTNTANIYYEEVKLYKTG